MNVIANYSRQRGLPFALGLLVSLAALTASPPVRAVTPGSTIVVDSHTDDGIGCTLREAVAAYAAGADSGDCTNLGGAEAYGTGDTILFQDGLASPIVLTQGPITIFSNLNIAGPGARLLAISGNDASRIFNIGNVSVELSRLSLIHGRAIAPDGDGGAIRNFGPLTLRDMQFAENRAADGYLDSGPRRAGHGGAIYHASNHALTVLGSTFYGNSAGQGRAGPDGTGTNGSNGGDGGAIYNSAIPTTTIANSTFVANAAGNGGDGGSGAPGPTCTGPFCPPGSDSGGTGGNGGAAGRGGAIFNDAGSTLHLIHSSLSGNIPGTPGSGGAGGAGVNGAPDGAAGSNGSSDIASALYNDGQPGCGGPFCAPGGTLVLANSLLDAHTGINCAGGSDITLSGVNLIHRIDGDAGSTAGTCGGIALTGDPLLGALADNGGDTDTLALAAGSPAVDMAGDTPCADAPVSGRDQRGTIRPAGACDIGAFEFVEPPSAVSITRNSPSPTNASSMSWTVTFSEAVTGVDASDFDALGTVNERDAGDNTLYGADYGVSGVSGSGAAYTVTVTVSGNGGGGSVQLSLQDDDSIKAVDDAAPLGGVDPGNGGLQGETYVIDRDFLPDSFDFADVSGVAPGSVQTATTTITGNHQPTAVSVTGGSYSVGCTGSFTTGSGTISGGQTVCVRHTAAFQYSTTVTTTLTVGTVSGSFNSTTRAGDTTPNRFRFARARNVEPGSIVESNLITVTGIDSPAPISVTGGDYRIYTAGVPGAYTSAPGQVAAGQQVRLRHTATLMFRTQTAAQLVIGGVSGNFVSRTRSPPRSRR